MRYVYPNGRFVSRAEVRSALDHALRAEQRAMRSLAIRLRNGRISLADWQSAMRQSVKNIHIYSSASARGGFAQMTQSDYGFVGQRIRRQYQFIDRFAANIERGMTLDGRFMQRVELYAQSGRGTYHAQDGRYHRQQGFTEERSNLGYADHCGGCIDEADKGWREIGTLVPVGDRQCLSRCHCSMEYR